MSFKYIIFVCLFLFLFLMQVPLLNNAIAGTRSKVLIAPVVVKVNDKPVYETELLYFLISQKGQEIVAELIENLILAQKADEFNVMIDPDLPRREMIEAYGEEKFKGLSEAFDLERVFTAMKYDHLAAEVYDALIERLITDNKLEVTQKESKKFYLDNKEYWSRPAKTRFSIIVTESREDIEAAASEISNGAAFSEVAARYSTDKASREKGGDTGFITRGTLGGPAKILEDAIFDLPENQISDVITVENNFFLVVPTRHIPGVEKSYREVEQYIMDTLLEEKVDPYLKIKLAEYRDDAQIEMVYPVFDVPGQSDPIVKITDLPPAKGKCLVYPTVVRVNGEEIHEQEMLFFLISSFGQPVLQELIENAAISQQAESLGVTVEEDYPDKILEESFDPEKLEALEEAFNMDHIRESITREILARKTWIKKKSVIAEENNIVVTEADAKRYYDVNKKRYIIPERVRFSIIVTEREEEMKAVTDKLKSGVPFEDVAREYSIDEMTSEAGGDIGTLWPRGFFTGPFIELEDVIFELQIGEISDMIFIEDRFYLVKTTEKHDAEEINFDEVKEEIIADLVNVKTYPLMAAWLDEIQSGIELDISYPIFDESEDVSLRPMGDVESEE